MKGPFGELDVSVIVTAHNEGSIVLLTLRSIARAVRFATERRNLRCEIIGILDSADLETARILREELGPLARIFEVTYSDPGLARNYGIERAIGRHLAIIDGDNLVTENWLVRCHDTIQALTKDSWILHPGFEVGFGSTDYIKENVDQRSGHFSPWTFLIANFWDTISFSRRETYLETKYSRTLHEYKLGFEDWQWNMEVIAKGGVHVPVAGTVHFKRIKESGSVNQEVESKGYLVLPTELFKSNDRLEKWAASMPDGDHRRPEGELTSELREMCDRILELEPTIKHPLHWNGLADVTPRLHAQKLRCYRSIYNTEQSLLENLGAVSGAVPAEEFVRILASVLVHKRPEKIRISTQTEIGRMLIEKHFPSLQMGSEVSIVS